MPCYKRPEYTAQCINALEVAQNYSVNTCFFLWDDGSHDNTGLIHHHAKIPAYLYKNRHSFGLRNVIIDFFEELNTVMPDVEIIGKLDNDCLVPKDWLTNLLTVFEQTDVDILSPNVEPSNAAFAIGRADPANPWYRPAPFVGGLWFMRKKMLDGIQIEEHDLVGIKGAFNILKQIILEKEPKVGWVPQVTVQDIGHWSGQHPEHIKTSEHEMYYQEVGRNVSW